MNARVTPILRIGAAVLKLENLQITGSFKVRGALEYVRRQPADSLERGLCTVSAGNHGAGLAFAAAQTGIPVTVFVPEHTPRNKVNRIGGLGATVLIRGALYDECERIAKGYASQRGLEFVSPF